MNKSKQVQSLPVLNPNAAGIDIGASFHVVAIPPDRDSESVRTFKAFTGDIEQMADWLVLQGISTVAMESTGVYWVPVVQLLGTTAKKGFCKKNHYCPAKKNDRSLKSLSDLKIS